MDEKLSRRDVLQTGAVLGVVAAVGTVACNNEKKALSCTDTTSLSATDAQVRTSLAYVDHSTKPGKSCVHCQQFIPPHRPRVARARSSRARLTPAETASRSWPSRHDRPSVQHMRTRRRPARGACHSRGREALTRAGVRWQ
jgi:hypothetical protein